MERCPVTGKGISLRMKERELSKMDFFSVASCSTLWASQHCLPFQLVEDDGKAINRLVLCFKGIPMTLMDRISTAAILHHCNYVNNYQLKDLLRCTLNTLMDFRRDHPWILCASSLNLSVSCCWTIMWIEEHAKTTFGPRRSETTKNWPVLQNMLLFNINARGIIIIIIIKTSL